MNLIRNLLAVSFVLLIVACGQSPETTAANDASAPPPPASAAASDAESSTSGAAPTVIVEESAADESDNNVDDIVLAAADTGAAATAAAEPQKYLEGKHYSKLAAAQGTSSAPDVIEVAEVFWYGCPHCYSFDPFVTQWSGELEPGVEFVRLPVMWNPTNQIHARIFYTAEVLGKLEEMHEEVFKEMHVNKKMLTTESAIEDFFVRYGVSAEDFQKTFRSFAVESKLKRAKNLTQRYQIRSVPLLVVNGKYVTSGDGIRNFDDMLAVADELIALEQAER